MADGGPIAPQPPPVVPLVQPVVPLHLLHHQLYHQHNKAQYHS